MEINTKDVKLVKTKNFSFYQFCIFGINFHNDCTSGYSLYNLQTCFTSKDCLFGAVKLTKNVDSDRYSHSRYIIGFRQSISIIYQ